MDNTDFREFMIILKRALNMIVAWIDQYLLKHSTKK